MSDLEPAAGENFGTKHICKNTLSKNFGKKQRLTELLLIPLISRIFINYVTFGQYLGLSIWHHVAFAAKCVANVACGH